MTVLSADDYAAITSMDLHALDLTHPRTRQALSGQVGISDLGKCQEQTRLLIGQQQPTDSPSTWAAQVGTALHDKWAAARAAGNPRLMHNVKVELTLPNGLVVPGTADEVDPDEPSVTDAKTKNGLAVVRRQGADRQQRWQRHGYYGALVQAGILPAEGIVRNVFLDRSGKDDRPHVEQEPYDPTVLDEMAAWLDEVVDAHKAGHEALKEKPRTFCRSYCLAAETEVVTAEGIRPIGDLAGGVHELLVPAPQRGGMTWHGHFEKVTVESFGVQPLLRLTLRRGKAIKVVHATPEHLWFTENGTVETRHLLRGTHLRSIRRNDIARLREVPFAVAQGFVYGDGSAPGTNRGAAEVAIYDASPKYGYMRPYFAGHELRRTSQDHGWIVTMLPRAWKEAPRLDESRSFLLSWLAGYFAADGSVTKAGQATMSSASLDSAQTIRSVAALIGLGYGPITTAYRRGFGAEDSPLYTVTLRARDLPLWFFKNPTHRERASSLSEKSERPRKDWRVVEVEPTDRVEEVFCAVVPEVEAFALADELLTHNCQFYSMCRLPEVDAPLLFDAALAEKVDDYYAADRDEKEAKQRKEELREFVEGVTGFTRTARIQSTWINKSATGSWRVEVTAL